MRFFLALIVVLSHLRNPFGPYLKEMNPHAANILGVLLNHLFCGAGAVIAFFIISGFVIHYPNKHRTRLDVPKFYIKRLLRICLPMVVLYFLLHPVNSKAIGKVPYWSLVCELAYYILYPLLFAIKVKWKYKLYAVFILSTIVLITFNIGNIASLVHQHNIGYAGSYTNNNLFITGIIGLPCWMLGVMLAERVDDLAYKVTKQKIWIWRGVVFISGMALMMMVVHFYVSYAISMNFFAVLLYVWIEKEIIYYRHHAASQTFEYFGKFSYSIYICHVPCIMLLLQMGLRPGMYTYFLYIFIILVASYLFYLAVEYPSHRFAQWLGNMAGRKETVPQ